MSNELLSRCVCSSHASHLVQREVIKISQVDNFLVCGLWVAQIKQLTRNKSQARFERSKIQLSVYLRHVVFLSGFAYTIKRVLDKKISCTRIWTRFLNKEIAIFFRAVGSVWYWNKLIGCKLTNLNWSQLFSVMVIISENIVNIERFIKNIILPTAFLELFTRSLMQKLYYFCDRLKNWLTQYYLELEQVLNARQFANNLCLTRNNCLEPGYISSWTRMLYKFQTRNCVM